MRQEYKVIILSLILISNYLNLVAERIEIKLGYVLPVTNNLLRIQIYSDGEIPQEIKTILQNGVPIKIYLTLKFFRKSVILGDSLIKKMLIEKQVFYDFVKGKYVSIIGGETNILGDDWNNLYEAFNFDLYIPNPILPLTPEEAYSFWDKYYIVASFNVSSVELYFPFNVIMNLIGSWNFSSKELKLEPITNTTFFFRQK